MSNTEPQMANTEPQMAAPEREKEVSGVFPFLKDSFPFCMLPSPSSKDN